MNTVQVNSVRILPRPEASGFLFEKGIFGVNLEITRKGFFGGLCAQMLNNRKLFMGTDSVDGWICESFDRITDRPEESLCHSHFVILTNGSMSQTSEVISLQEGRTYEAKVWAKAISETAEITFGVSGMEKTFSVAADGAPYHELSYTFAGMNVENGLFSIRVTGQVAIYEVSLMPTDHIHGMSRDVI